MTVIPFCQMLFRGSAFNWVLDCPPLVAMAECRESGWFYIIGFLASEQTARKSVFAHWHFTHTF
jgi:hypothetical protein